MKEERIKIDKIIPFISRKHDPEILDKMKSSIKQFGVILPISVIEQKDGTYEVIKGEGRTIASKLAGESTVPAYVFTPEEMTSTEKSMHWISTNFVRAKDPLKRASLFNEELKLGLSISEIAKKYFISENVVKNDVESLKHFSEKTKERVSKKFISFTNAKRISNNFKDAQAQDALSKLILKTKQKSETTRLLLNTAKKIESRGEKVTTPNLRKELKDISSNNNILRQGISDRRNNYVFLNDLLEKFANDKKLNKILQKQNLEVIAPKQI